MITVFTTAKPFTGQMKINQVNALKSWKSISPDIDIILFGTGQGFTEVAAELRITHLPDVDTSEQGTPLFNSMCETAQKLGRHKLYAFINCDIILLDDFLPAVQNIKFERFLMVGQRWDINLNREIEFENKNWIQAIREEVWQKATLHPPLGSDYFVYKGSVWENLPPVIIGRGYMDNELISHCRIARTPVVDASEAITAIHQNHNHSHHPQGKDGVYEGVEAVLNRKNLDGLGITFTPVDSDWRLNARGVRRSYCRGNWSRYLKVLQVLNPGTLQGYLANAALTCVHTAKHVTYYFGGASR